MMCGKMFRSDPITGLHALMTFVSPLKIQWELTHAFDRYLGWYVTLLFRGRVV